MLCYESMALNLLCFLVKKTKKKAHLLILSTILNVFTKQKRVAKPRSQISHDINYGNEHILHFFKPYHSRSQLVG